MNAQFGDAWEAVSAGAKPTGYVHPRALHALAEVGIEHHGRSKSVDEFRDAPFDLVVTVCDSAAEECPAWLGAGKRVHDSFPDPAKAEGTDEQVMNVFRTVRDRMERELRQLLEQQVILLSVIRGSDVPLPETLNQESLEYWRWNLGEHLNVAKMALEGKGLRTPTRSAYGNPVEQIVQVAADERVDAIVMGAQGATATQELLIGSTAYEVMRRATVPVLL